MFACMECGKKFKTVRAAEKASYFGCPKCGGVDIDVDYSATTSVFEKHKKKIDAENAKMPDAIRDIMNN